MVAEHFCVWDQIFGVFFSFPWNGIIDCCFFPLDVRSKMITATAALSAVSPPVTGDLFSVNAWVWITLLLHERSPRFRSGLKWIVNSRRKRLELCPVCGAALLPQTPVCRRSLQRTVWEHLCRSDSWANVCLRGSLCPLSLSSFVTSFSPLPFRLLGSSTTETVNLID